MSYTERFTETHVILAQEPPDSLGIATVNSAWISFANIHRATLVLQVGDMVPTSTLDALLQQASDSTGTGVKAIAGKAITQLTQAGGDGNQAVAIELKSIELDVAGGFEFVRVQTTVAAAASEVGWILYGVINRFVPVSQTLWTEVVD